MGVVCAARAQARLRPGHLGPRDASWPGGWDEHLGPAAQWPQERDTTSPEPRLPTCEGTLVTLARPPGRWDPDITYV